MTIGEVIDFQVGQEKQEWYDLEYLKFNEELLIMIYQAEQSEIEDEREKLQHMEHVLNTMILINIKLFIIIIKI